MAEDVISYRISEPEIDALKALRQPGESLSLTAKRLMRQALGVFPETKAGERLEVYTSVDSVVDTLVDKIVDSDKFEELLEKRIALALEKSIA